MNARSSGLCAARIARTSENVRRLTKSAVSADMSAAIIGHFATGPEMKMTISSPGRIVSGESTEQREIGRGRLLETRAGGSVDGRAVQVAAAGRVRGWGD